MNLRKALSRSPLFEEFSPSELEVLERIFTVKQYEDGHVFIREGEAVTSLYDALYFIVEGKVVVTKKPPTEGGFGMVRMLGAGEVIGLIALICGGARTATCRAAGMVEAASLMKNSFDALCNSDVHLAEKFEYLVARQLAHDLRGATRELVKAVQEGVLDPEDGD